MGKGVFKGQDPLKVIIFLCGFQQQNALLLLVSSLKWRELAATVSMCNIPTNILPTICVWVCVCGGGVGVCVCVFVYIRLMFSLFSSTIKYM